MTPLKFPNNMLVIKSKHYFRFGNLLIICLLTITLSACVHTEADTNEPVTSETEIQLVPIESFQEMMFTTFKGAKYQLESVTMPDELSIVFNFDGEFEYDDVKIYFAMIKEVLTHHGISPVKTSQTVTLVILDKNESYTQEYTLYGESQ